MIHHQHEQGSPEWLDARRGVVTGSRFKDCRAKLKNGQPSNACLAYAYDVARERCGGMAPAKFQNAAMRIGVEQEAHAVRLYEVRTGYLTEEVGFFTTEDRMFGLSPDRLVDDDGVLEVVIVRGQGFMYLGGPELTFAATGEKVDNELEAEIKALQAEAKASLRRR